jgi:hypothetical protein
VKSANNPVLANKINQVCIFPNKKSQLQIAAGIVHFRKNYLLIVIDMGTQLRHNAILGLKTSNPFACLSIYEKHQGWHTQNLVLHRDSRRVVNVQLNYLHLA